MSDRDHRFVKASYWAMCDLIDEQVGRMMEALERTGQLENTIVIYMSDHGEMLGDHGLYLKGPYFYEPAVRVPLIISYPGVVTPQTSTALVELGRIWLKRCSMLLTCRITPACRDVLYGDYYAVRLM